MKKTVLTSLIACSLLFSTGCAQTCGNNANTGAILGGITGALIGSGHGGHNNSAATLLGAFAGAIIGSEIGAYMDELDREYAERAFYEAADARVGRVIVWHNPQNRHHGRVIVIREGRTRGGEYYREFQNQVVVEGRMHKSYTKAYRRPNGSWRVMQ